MTENNLEENGGQEVRKGGRRREKLNVQKETKRIVERKEEERREREWDETGRKSKEGREVKT